MPTLDDATTAVATIERKIEKKLTLLWHEIEEWQQDNHYIHSGYRQQSNSYATSAGSLGYLHNETVNIYTHLIGAVVAVLTGAILYRTLQPRYETASFEDVVVFGCFFGGAAACLGMSATFHTLANHSPSVSRAYNKLDYLGIVFLIWGSFIPSLYYGFQERPDLIRVYWTMITSIALATAVVSLSPFFAGHKYRTLRAIMFVAMGLSAVFPVLHGLKVYPVARLDELIGLRWMVLQGALYILGAGLYAARIPERFRPGAFDIWGASHQIFHVLVLVAAMAHLIGLLKAFDYRHSRTDLPSDIDPIKFRFT